MVPLTFLKTASPWVQMLLLPFVTAVCYYLGARFGLALSFKPDYIAALWPPNAILLCALLLTSPSRWGYFLLAAVPAELLADLPAGIPGIMSVGFVVSDWIEVLTAALLYRKYSTHPPTFKTLRQTGVFIVCCAMVGPFVAAFPGAVITGFDPTGPPILTRWFRWFMGDALTHLVLTPPFVLWLTWKPLKPFFRSLWRGWEFSLFIILLSIAGIAIVGSRRGVDLQTFPALLYLHLPFLIWAAVRFNPRCVFSTACVATLIGIWISSRGLGPFHLNTASLSVFNLQLFYILSLTPIFFLASLMVERRRTEEKLLESEEKYRTVADFTYNMETWRTPDDMYRYVSPSCERITGHPVAEFLVNPNLLIKITHPDDQAKVTEHFLEANHGTGTPNMGCDFRILTPNGDIRWLGHSCTAVHGRDGQPLGRRESYRDITIRKHAEEEKEKTKEALEKAKDELEQRVTERTVALEKSHKQLLHAEKLATVGKFSAAIAHEFNNPLQSIMTIIKGIEKYVPLKEEEKELVALALQECHRMKTLIINLSDFYRPTSGKTARVDIHRVLDAILMISKKDLQSRNIVVRKKYGNIIPQVSAVADQLKQVFLNLLNNGADACEGGGEIVITTEQSGQNVAIHVEDNGVGIDSKDIGHIFEPFFTTKAALKGTGLGLSVSYGIIQKHGGSIEVASESGKGSRFSVFLPAAGGDDEQSAHTLWTN